MPAHTQEPAITKRPGSQSSIDDDDVLLGRVLASQSRIERGWESLKVEHETYTSTVVHLKVTVDELLIEQKKLIAAQALTHKLMRRFGKLVPAALAVFEVLRTVLAAKTGAPH